MIIKSLKLWDFRKFHSHDGNPGLSVEFHSGLNALIGENDAGKSAVIDALKIVLQTQSGEYIRVLDDDFYTAPDTAAEEFRIDCVIGDFNTNEAKNFLEYLVFKKNENGNTEFFLNLHFRAWKEKERIYTELRAGEDPDSITVDGKARELLKCVYLRPLRDAAKEMHSGRNSRISQILLNHPIFRGKDDNALVGIFKEANQKIDKFFIEQEGKEILSTLRQTLQKFIEANESSNAEFKTSEMHLKPILESLSLISSEIQPGLGAHNLLFIAAELLLLNHDDNGGLRLALIEELEAHLHPQAQLRLIDYLQREYNDSGVQIIISTHSTVLASKINVKNIILMKNNTAYDMSPEKTMLKKGDYLFLQRFLDSTKANLFFAKGIIMVEGDAENLLIPVIADIIGYNLEQNGISIVNVGNLAFHRYSNIFLRSDGSTVRLPVSIITDCDVEPKYEDVGGAFCIYQEKTDQAIEEKQGKLNDRNVRSFISPYWTFEYCIALSCLKWIFYESVLQASKIENSDTYALTADKISDIDTIVASEKKCKTDMAKYELAYYMYFEKMLRKKQSPISKAIVAQCLSSNLRWDIIEKDGTLGKEMMFDIDMLQVKVSDVKKNELKDEIEADPYLKYIVDAIKYAAGEGA